MWGLSLGDRWTIQDRAVHPGFIDGTRSSTVPAFLDQQLEHGNGVPEMVTKHILWNQLGNTAVSRIQEIGRMSPYLHAFC